MCDLPVKTCLLWLFEALTDNMNVTVTHTTDSVRQLLHVLGHAHRVVFIQSLKPLESTISGNKGADYVTPKVSTKLTNKLSSFMKHERTGHILFECSCIYCLCSGVRCL
jgi:hypothetical protein